MNETTPAAGWYPDPTGDLGKLRYWNGIEWTDQYQAAPQQPLQNTPGVPVQQIPYASQAAPAGDNPNLAIASLVFGIFGPFAAVFAILGYTCGITAIVFGAKSLKSTRRKMAIAGIILGVISLLAAVFSSFIGLMMTL